MRIGDPPRKIMFAYTSNTRYIVKLTHLASVGFAEILPYASAVGEDDVSVGIQFVRELAPASILVDNGLDSLQRLGVRGHTRDWYPAPPAGDGEYFGTLLQETPDCFDLEDSILGFVIFRSKIIILSIRSSRQICTDFRMENRCRKEILFAAQIIIHQTNHDVVSKETHSTGGGLGTTLLKYSPSGFMTHPRL